MRFAYRHVVEPLVTRDASGSTLASTLPAQRHERALVLHHGRVLREQIAAWGQADFREPAAPEAIQTAEARLGAPLPNELRELLSETDGVVGEHGLGLVWAADRIGEDNAHFRSNPNFSDLYLPFEGLVFFSDAGNGDQFAISLRGAQDVFMWDHEDDSRIWVASTILDFLRRRMTGELTI